MGLMDMFQKATNSTKIKCKKCGNEETAYNLTQNLYICPNCGYYYRLGARDRIELTVDKKSFTEIDTGLTARIFLEFPSYADKLEKAKSTQKKRTLLSAERRQSAEKKSLCLSWILNS